MFHLRAFWIFAGHNLFFNDMCYFIVVVMNFLGKVIFESISFLLSTFPESFPYIIFFRNFIYESTGTTISLVPKAYVHVQKRYKSFHCSCHCNIKEPSFFFVSSIPAYFEKKEINSLQTPTQKHKSIQVL